MRFVVVGAGAIGGSVGALLERGGESIAYVARGEHGRCMRNRGLRLRAPGFEYMTSGLCCETVGEIDWSAGDIALVATKLNDAKLLLDELHAAAGRDVPVVMLTNGIDGQPWASELFTTAIAAMVWMPATHLVPGEVAVHAADPYAIIDLGASHISERIAQAFRRVSIDVRVRDDIDRWMLAKLFTNIGNSAQALVSDDWMAVAKAAKQEAAPVLACLEPPPIDPESFRNRIADLSLLDVAGVEREGGSTWQSRRRGKPLETEYLEGVIVKLAREQGVETPINQTLVEAARSPRDMMAREIIPPSA